MNQSARSYIGICAIVFGAACSSSIGPDTGLRTWPERPAGAPTPQSELARRPRTFAATSIRLGGDETWKGLGYDLDGLSSLKDAKDACAPKLPGVAADGIGGIDNSFGQNALILLSYMTSRPDTILSAESAQNRALQDGTFTLLFQTNGLSDGSTTDGLTAQLFVGGPLDEAPAATGRKRWAAHADYVRDGDPARARTKFENAYINRGVFVSGQPTTIELVLMFHGSPLPLTLHRAVVTWTTAGATLNQGVIAGVLSASELVRDLQALARQIKPETTCGGEVDMTLATVGNYVDILVDGKPDPSRECDGLSFGIGFTAQEVEAPSRVSDPIVSDKDPCKP